MAHDLPAPRLEGCGLQFLFRNGLNACADNFPHECSVADGQAYYCGRERAQLQTNWKELIEPVVSHEENDKQRNPADDLDVERCRPVDEWQSRHATHSQQDSPHY